MAMNPMQRKANNYFLIGVLVTLLITGCFIIFLFMQLSTLQKEKKEQEAMLKSVYVVSQDIKSGETVSYDKLKTSSINKTFIPSNALTVDLDEKENIAKIDLKAGTVITDNMIQEKEEQTTNDLRKQEYNMVLLPSQIQNGDYIDIRIRFSNGVDYIVASKKKITIPTVNDVESRSSFSINMNEAEIMVMANAIVEAYEDQGSLLYCTTYVEPGMQNAVTPTYVPSGTVQQEMYANPNLAQEAKNGLFARYNQNSATRTNVINGVLSQYDQDKVDNIEAGVQAEIAKAQEEREAYLESLGGY